MLISPMLLSAASSQYLIRNLAIEILSQNKSEDTEKLYKQVLSLWLGSNTTLIDDLIMAKEIPNLFAGYCIVLSNYCFIILDKKISVLDPTSEAYADLDQCRHAMLAYYNENFRLLTVNPLGLFAKFICIIRKLNDDIAIVQQIKQLCLAEFDRASSTHMSKPLFSTLKVNMGFRKFVNCALVGGAVLHPSYQFTLTDENHTARKILIPAFDGVILDGLLIQNSRILSDTVVLALVGHFQSEDRWFKKTYTDYQKLFGCDVVFINHRNFSIRSDRRAQNLEELANDVVQFVKYFQHKGKKIVLYGMCGGSAQMILAGNLLVKEKIPFKLIVDRFASKYIDFMDLKTIQRLLIISNYPIGYKRKLLIFGLVTSLIRIPYLILKLVFMFANVNFNFADRIRMIPQNNVLILQAKSKRCEGVTEPYYTDINVHPKNDIRFAIKDIRQINQAILRKISKYCRQIDRYYSDCQSSLRAALLQLAKCCEEYLNLIDNEKLKIAGPIEVGQPKNIHTNKLPELTTRHELPLSTFLRGFFVKPIQVCDDTIKKITVYSASDFLATLHVLHPHSKNSLVAIALYLHELFSEIKKQESFICHVGNRLCATGLGNMCSILQELMNSELYSSIVASKSQEQMEVVVR